MGKCSNIIIIGGGLAGAEAAWHAAQSNTNILLYEMRPTVSSPAHNTDYLAELVCSNSLKSNLLTNACGLLKEEMRRLNSVTIACADAVRVPAGEALAVDRDKFAEMVTSRILGLKNVEIIREEMTHIPDDGIVIIASGPLTSDSLASEIKKLTGAESMYFYDAVAPTITADSIDYTKVFKASRWGKGEAAYLNCPMNKDEYDAFYNALIDAEKVPLANFEDVKLFEGCMPIEEMAARGRKTLTFGPMKPAGLDDPKTGRWPYAAVQLRQENTESTLWGLVGFQTRLKWSEQARVFRMIPGLEKAEFIRYGVMHRNTYINSPNLLLPTLQLREQPNIFFAGQITGVEGYVESAAMGMLAGINASRIIQGKDPVAPPVHSMMGSLAHYVSSPQTDSFQPMNANFGILPKPETKIKAKKERQLALAESALLAIDEFVSKLS